MSFSEDFTRRHITKSDWMGDKNIGFSCAAPITPITGVTLRTPDNVDDSEEEIGEDFDSYEETHYSTSPMDLGESGLHAESPGPFSPISQLTREFQDFCTEMQDEFRNFCQDVYD